MNYYKEPGIEYDCTVGTIHDAIYTKPLLTIDEGNRNIEALPPRLTEEQVAELYYKAMRVSPHPYAPVEVQMAEIGLLDELRIVVPFADEFESQVYNKLLVSYRARQQYSRPIEQDAVIADRKTTQNITMQPSLNSDGDMGIALIGVGGTGKTNAIQCLTEHYPQAVRHITEKGQYVQILWIRIEVPATGDMETLLNCFGEELDRALGNTRPIYSTTIRKVQKLSQKVLVISELIRRFSIGMLIIDEIQRLKYGRANRPESYANIIDIVDKSKVVLVVAGTEKAYSLFLGKYYNHRRIGVQISTTTYSYDRDNFDLIAGSIMSINWFRTSQDVTSKPILDAMFTETSGTIARLISVWKTVQNEYVRLDDEEKQTFVLTPKFIHLCSRKQNKSQAEDIRLAVETDFAMRMENEVDGSICHPSPEVKTPPLLSNDELRTIEQEKRKELTYRLMALPRPDCVLRIFERARMNISENGYTNVTDDMIEEAVTIVLKQKVSLKQSEDELLAKTLQKTRGIMKRNKKGTPTKNVTAIPESPTEINLVEFSPELLK